MYEEDNESASALQEKLAGASPAVFKGFLYRLQATAWTEGFKTGVSDDPDPFNPYLLLIEE